MPVLDTEAVRREFRRLDRTGGAWRTDRPPTREDIHAHWHWRTERVLLAAGHLAGYTGRPSGAALFRMLTEGTADEDERMWLAELLCDIRPEDYPQLRRRDALSARHIARAALGSGVLRGALSWWLNQFAERPAG